MTIAAEPATAVLGRQIEALKQEVAELRDRAPQEKAAVIVFSGDLDRVPASMVLATGAATAGLDTTTFPAHHAPVSEIDAHGIGRAPLGHLRRSVPDLQIRRESESSGS